VAEVEILIRDGLSLIPIEAKITATPRISMARGLNRFRKDYPENSTPGWLVFAGDDLLPMGSGNRAVPFDML